MMLQGEDPDPVSWDAWDDDRELNLAVRSDSLGTSVELLARLIPPTPPLQSRPPIDANGREVGLGAALVTLCGCAGPGPKLRATYAKTKQGVRHKRSSNSIVYAVLTSDSSKQEPERSNIWLSIPRVPCWSPTIRGRTTWSFGPWHCTHRTRALAHSTQLGTSSCALPECHHDHHRGV